MDEIMLRTSERNTFKQCQWKWEREYQDRLKPKHQKADALWFGTGIHLALEKWYVPGKKRGANPIETWMQYVEDTAADTTFINTNFDGDSTLAVEAGELGKAMLYAYIDEYGEDEHMEVLATEMPFNVGIKYKTLGGDTKTARYVGTMDLVYRDQRDGKVFALDHKTCRQLGSANTQYLRLDDQAGAYYAVAATVLRDKGLIGPKETIAGIDYNYLVKAMPDNRPRNKEGYATNKPTKKHYLEQLPQHGVEVADKMTVKQLQDLAEQNGVQVFGEVSANQPSKRFERVRVRRTQKEQVSQIRRIADDLTAMQAVRDGTLKATKAPSRNCTFCPFRDICELNEDGRDYTDMAAELYAPWDPYEAHRKENS